jgi:hypothetical protein
MAAGDQYRIKAEEFNARAQSEARPQMRVELEHLAKAHLRLAAQADLNERAEMVDDLCRELGATGGKSKRRPYAPLRPTSAMQKTGRNGLVASVTKRRVIPLAVVLLAMATIALFVFW